MGVGVISCGLAILLKISYVERARNHTMVLNRCVLSAKTAIHTATGIFGVSGDAIRGSIARGLHCSSPRLCGRMGTILRGGGDRQRVHKNVTAGQGCGKWGKVGGFGGILAGFFCNSVVLGGWRGL